MLSAAYLNCPGVRDLSSSAQDCRWWRKNSPSYQLSVPHTCKLGKDSFSKANMNDPYAFFFFFLADETAVADDVERTIVRCLLPYALHFSGVIKRVPLFCLASAVCGQPGLLFQVSGTGSCTAINLRGHTFITSTRAVRRVNFSFSRADGTAYTRRPSRSSRTDSFF